MCVHTCVWIVNGINSNLSVDGGGSGRWKRDWGGFLGAPGEGGDGAETSPRGVRTGRGKPECPPMEMLTHSQAYPSPELVPQVSDSR